MDRRQRRELLERLIAYRRAYRLRSDYDATPLMSVADAVAYGELVLRRERTAGPAAPAA